MALDEIIQPIDPDTRQRLLDAAGPVFAAKGFREATVREICQTAGANVAAVNYHFGDKLGLYRAVFAEGYERVIGSGKQEVTARPMPADPEEAVRAFVGEMVDRAMMCGQRGPGSGSGGGAAEWMSSIMMREMIEPTEVLDEFVGRVIRPRQQFLATAIGQMLGLPRDDERVIRCVYSVVGQVLFYRHCREVVARLWPVKAGDEACRQGVAVHIAEFSIAAIRALAAGKAGGA